MFAVRQRLIQLARGAQAAVRWRTLNSHTGLRGIQVRYFNRRKSGPPEEETPTADPLWFHEMKSPTYETTFRCFLGLGSNLGGDQRLRSLERALLDIRNFGEIVSTSALYETMPESLSPDEPRYINAVVEISTSLPPHELMKAMQGIELAHGRPLPGEEGRKGSRTIDIDILTYGDSQIDKGDLKVPHPRMHLREFVLRPMNDIDPNLKIPGMRHTVADLYKGLRKSSDADDESPMIDSDSCNLTDVVRPFIPTSRESGSAYDRHRQSLFGDQGSELGFTRSVLPALMGIVNVTPDSFSDGGKFIDVDKAYMHCLRLLADGASILDIGGASTRPGAKPVSAEEELERVLPLLEKIRAELPEHTVVSIDTNQPQVAREVLKNGADWINDVYGGRDPDMIRAIAEQLGDADCRRGASFVIMHMRGTPETMDDMTDYKDVVAEVGSAISDRIGIFAKAGVPRWRLYADPGLGFAKTQAQSAQLLTQLTRFRSHLPSGMPIVLGYSRKRVVDHLLKLGLPMPPTSPTTMQDRDLGGLGLTAWATLQNVDVIRLHDVRPASLVCSSTSSQK